MHSAVLKKVKYHKTLKNESEIFMDKNSYIKLVQNSKFKTSEK
jgi:hypothetical protein